jgi:hypothetical protein
MKTLVIVPIALAIAAPSSLVRADTVYMDPNDPGKVTSIAKGVWELDLGALGVLSYNTDSGTSVTQLSTDTSVQLHYFIKDNVSVGIEALFDYDSDGSGNNTVAYGGAIDAAVHLRLGLGAFFRPGIAIGALFGTRDLPQSGGSIQAADELGFVARLQLPIAYFASRRFLLQAGPQINITVGSYTPSGADAVSFTRIAGGFAVGVGYVF